MNRVTQLRIIDEWLEQFAPPDRELIFERFWRGRAVTSAGAGLGLAIVKEIVNAHRGSITVDANANGGAKFTLSFPPATP
jgi:signal transduction histidine kinase